MDVEKYKAMTAPCFRDEAPPCTSVCPLGMDTRTFIAKMKAGKYKAAYRAFRPKAVFPGIVSELCPEPCMKACVRTRQGKEPVRMKELEAFCFEKAVSKPERYRLAKKEETIAVVGGGLCGLSCAYRLASRGYHITVFEKNENVGGLALTLMDPEKALSDITREFSELDVCRFETAHEINENEFPELTSSFSAVFIATGEKGPDFGRTVKDIFKTDMPGVFRGGLINGDKNLIEAMADGFNAAEYIELYFKLGKDAVPDFELSGAKEPDERFYKLTFDENELPSPAEFDPEAEASKCYECNCGECYRVCPLMQQFQKYPQKIASDTIGTLRPNKYSRPGVRMLMSCTFCGKCKEVCPVGIDMGNLFRLARRDFYDDETMPESFHEFWLQDMEFSLSDEASAFYTPDPDKPTEYIFFPGCQLAGMAPGTVENAYAYIRSCSYNASLMLGCCGVPADWAGAEPIRKKASDRIREIWEKAGHPVFILACTACRRNLAEFCPEIGTVSLYSYMAARTENLPAPVKGPEDGKYRIFDPCGVSGDEETRQAVRSLAEKLGLDFEEPEGLPGCCGFGGHIYPANAGLQETIARKGSEDDGSIALAYCANCQDTFVKSGRRSEHILDLFFGQGECGRLPTFGERRNNRRILKQKVLSEEIMPYSYANEFTFTDDALFKMQRCLITEEDVDEVLNEKPLFSDADTGLFYSRKQIGKITLWVGFSKDGEKILVEDIYKYRMEVLE